MYRIRNEKNAAIKYRKIVLQCVNVPSEDLRARISIAISWKKMFFFHRIDIIVLYYLFHINFSFSFLIQTYVHF